MTDTVGFIGLTSGPKSADVLESSLADNIASPANDIERGGLLICRPRRRREARPAADPGLRNALTVSSSSASPCVAEVTRTERPRMRDVRSTAEEPTVCTTLRWRETDSNLRFRARRLRHFLPRLKPGLSADGNHSVGIDSGDRVLPTFGDLGGAVGPTDHPMGRRVRPQCDQIRPAGSGIKPAEFARGLRREP
jgi:hypothetical protein